MFEFAGGVFADNSAKKNENVCFPTTSLPKRRGSTLVVSSFSLDDFQRSIWPYDASDKFLLFSFGVYFAVKFSGNPKNSMFFCLSARWRPGNGLISFLHTLVGTHETSREHCKSWKCFQFSSALFRHKRLSKPSFFFSFWRFCIT